MRCALPIKVIIVSIFLFILNIPAIHDAAITQEISFLNDRAREITGAAAVYAPGFVMPGGLTGAGQIVAIADSGLDAGNINDLHPDLRSTPGKMPKVVLLQSLTGRAVPDDPSGHGTHMAATIAGTGAASGGKFRGVAPEASIYFQSILDEEGEPAPPADLHDLFWPAYSAGARIHVNGWGAGINTYQTAAAQIDDFMRNHLDFLAVFGAGNDGPATGSITTEANSKNALTVGASQLPRTAFVPNTEDTAAAAAFSSRGPAGDGRVKPELLAPASALISARSQLITGNLSGFPEYTRMQGTSMAAAVGGGSAALMREYFKTAGQIATPSAALIKSALVNGARPTAEEPSLNGFGVIDLAGTVIALKEGNFSAADELAGITNKEEKSYKIQVTAPASAFKATLVWTDLPGEPGYAKALVNDLDLLVRTPEGMVYYGNHFLGSNTPDKINNVEQVYLPNPVPGEYTVQVVGAGVSRNAVSGSGVDAQDYALVWGQAPVAGLVESIDTNTVKLAGRGPASLTELPVTNLLNGRTTGTDAGHLFPGAQAYLTPRRIYLIANQWRTSGVRVLGTAAGTVLAEINQKTRLGGYSLPADTDTVLLNGSAVSPGELPHGVEINGIVNPVDQKVRQVKAAYYEQQGVVASAKEVGGQKYISLLNDEKAYPLDKDVFYSYEDTYQGVDLSDQPFGTGALDELQEVLPGMAVLLRMSPTSGQVSYVAVKRQVKLGTVYRVIGYRNEIMLDNDSSIILFPGAPILRDRIPVDLSAVKPGDHVTAVLLPDTGEAVGLVVHSKVIYGKVIDFIRKERSLFLLDNNSRYHALEMDPDAPVYRWGLRVQEDVLTSGSLVRVTTGQNDKKVWRLDIGENFYKKGVFLEYNESKNLITFEDGEEYRVSKNTRYYKNDYQVQPGDLRSGELVDLEYVTVPPPAGQVLVDITAHPAAAPPPLFVSLVPLPEGLVVTGRTQGDNHVYIWQEGRKNTVVPDENGSFAFQLEPGAGNGYDFSVVSVDPRTGGVTGRRSSVPVPEKVNGEVRYPALKNAIAVLEQVMTDSASLPEGSNDLSQQPLTRLAAAVSLAKVFSWPEYTGRSLPFNDVDDIPAAYHPVVAEAWARGICQGYEDVTFRPGANLTRGEMAVLMTAVLQDTGVKTDPSVRLAYKDADDIPEWARDSVAACTAAGLLRGRPGGEFDAGALITCGDMKILLERLLTVVRDANIASTHA